MLIEFSVENFRSIRDEITFSMVPYSSNELDENKIHSKIRKNSKEWQQVELLNSSAIFGANSAGKSNIIEAIHYVLYCIKNSQSFVPRQEFPNEQFKLDERYLKKPSCFKFSFIYKNILYNYGFKILRSKVIEEYLNYAPNGKMVEVFNRTAKKINLFPTKNKLNKEQEIRLKIYEEEVSDNILILSLANKIKIPAVIDAYAWFSTKLLYVSNRPGIGGKTSELLKNKKIDKEFFISLLKYADTTIQDIKLVEQEIDINEIPTNVMNNVIKEIGRRNNVNIKDIDLKNVQARRIREYTNKLGKDINGNEINVDVPISQESSGTQKYYGLLGDVILSLKNGCCLVVDELELRLHTNLAKAIVELFSSPLNSKGAQLIFTTHNTNLLDTQKLLRRDQINFVEKNMDGVSELFSLLDFNVRKDKIIQKAYLEGIFGAIPHFNLEDLF